MDDTGEDYRDHPVRSFVLTGGRAEAKRQFRIDTLLIATDTDDPLPPAATRQARQLLELCSRMQSLVEAAALLGLPTSIVSVLASDLVDSNHLSWRQAIPKADAPDRDLLREVLHGLQKI
ncbi:DUF742 domain-containing protein [Streptomyces sp. NPDC093149]|uniref:DUF742 domain-containing protein n=1 Tax=Streptomyces sp. NPDC093149 TaxID=3366031 RepID=UPI0037FD690D